MLNRLLPDHPQRDYSAVNRCIYCGSISNLSREHIVPYALGGRWVLPRASCDACSRVTSAFERTCTRTILGALRMMYNIASRRKHERPRFLPLLVMQRPGEEWSSIDVPQEEYPFLVALPFFAMPDELSGYTTGSGRGGVTGKIWVRSASTSAGMRATLEGLCQRLKVAQVQPVGECRVHEFCLMLAKIAHSYSIAVIGNNSFVPFLPQVILKRNLDDRARYIGGLIQCEPDRPETLHEISFDHHTCGRSDLVSVRIRLFACLGAPTYFVVAGRRF